MALVAAWTLLAAGQDLLSPSCAEGLAKRSIRYSDLPAEFRGSLGRQGISQAAFSGYVKTIDRRTAERELIGEYDHLIYFMLQSGRFTARPKVEPALSAYQFVQRLGSEERARYLVEGELSLPPEEKLPPTAAGRLADFIQALKKDSPDERLAYFRSFTLQTAKPAETLSRRLYREYARSMKFLYRKEFLSKEFSSPRELTAYVASLYQDRGHSTDTQIEANFALYIALSALKAQTPAAQLDRVLIVGPGLDFAPRTDLIDLFGPQSYQPFAVADALLGLKLAAPDRLRVHCIDINDRVITYLRHFPKRQVRQLSILSGVADSAAHPLSDEYQDYFRGLGRSIGEEAALEVPGDFTSHLKKSLRVRAEVAERVSADRLNIITERYDPAPGYDLVIVTNVFPYFNDTELLLALSNISSMMAEGGYLLHNEMRDAISPLAATLGLPPIQARTVLIAAGKVAPLYDGVAIHRKTTAEINLK